jgi:hypothetical protein
MLKTSLNRPAEGRNAMRKKAVGRPNAAYREDGQPCKATARTSSRVQ